MISVDREHPKKDPELTEKGMHQAEAVHLMVEPQFVAMSPMTRTITTAIRALGPKLDHATVQIWPDLREAHDRLPNDLPPRDIIEAKFPQFDFSECRRDENYGSQTPSDAAARAERVRLRVRELTSVYSSILLMTHRGFCTYLVQGDNFANAECRTYRFADTTELSSRWGVNNDCRQLIDYGPTLLTPLGVMGT